MAATIFDGARELLDSIWEKNHRIWPEWLWDVSAATIEIVNPNKVVTKKKDKPIIAAGRKRIVVWTNRSLTPLEKETIPSFWDGWKVMVHAGSQLARERFLARLEDEAAQREATETAVADQS